MVTLKHSAQRVVLTGAVALAVAAGPLLALTVTPAAPTGRSLATCSNGEVETPTGECTPKLTGEAPKEEGLTDPNPAPNPDSGPTMSTPGDTNSLPEVDGIPCTGANTGKCIGLQEDQQAPDVAPQSSLDSSP